MKIYKMRIESTLDRMRTSSNWRQVFKYAQGFVLEDVAEVLASVKGENDGANWVAILRLQDGRYAYLTAWCDYTGWGCREGGESATSNTFEGIAQHLTDDDRSRLEGSVPIRLWAAQTSDLGQHGDRRNRDRCDQ